MVRKLGMCVVLAGLSLATSCTKQETGAAPAATYSTTKESPTGTTEEVYFADMNEFLDYFDALYAPGDTRTIRQVPQGIYIEEPVTGAPVACAAHTYSTKDKYKFARWCEKQLSDGKTLTVGKEQDGTYWADVKE